MFVISGGMFFLVNGPEMKQFPVDVRGFVVSASTKQPISMFGFDLQNPHDIAVSADGMDIYVAEIGPLKISKYTRSQYQTFIYKINLNYLKISLHVIYFFEY